MKWSLLEPQTQPVLPRRSVLQRRRLQRCRPADKSVSAATQTRYVPVWDAMVRFGHWALVAAFAVAYFSAEEEGGVRPLHVWCGYAVGVLVVLRVVWELVGPQHARFTDFICGPAVAARYLIDLMAGHARRYLGHSPAGGAMVIALLISLSATVATGLIADTGERGKGPLAGAGATVAALPYSDAKAAKSRPIRTSPLRGRKAQSATSMPCLRTSRWVLWFCTLWELDGRAPSMGESGRRDDQRPEALRALTSRRIAPCGAQSSFRLGSGQSHAPPEPKHRRRGDLIVRAADVSDIPVGA